MVRKPVVAGQFYPEQRDELLQMVSDFMAESQPSRPAIGAVVPHAGYVYSGAIAGKTLGAVEIPSVVILLGPNHTGFGAPLAVYPSGTWQSPLGDIPIDEPLSVRIIKECSGAMADERAHRFEHSLEVLIPFIQVRSPGASIVPICVGQSDLNQLLEFGKDLGTLVSSWSSDILLVASSDMTHFESAEKAREKDQKALKKILEIDPQGLYREVLEQRISMCGVFPTVVMLAAARELKASRSTLVQYGNSGDITGDLAEVVGYAGVVIE
jgi:AmmeMemoRadiSam system protein B